MVNKKKTTKKFVPTKKVDKKNFVWSEYQQAIFNKVKNSNENLAVIARAGSAKTTTLIESLHHLPQSKKVLVVAFNKSIQEELKNRVPKFVDCMTLHSLGFRALRQRFSNVIVDDKKPYNIVQSLINPNDYESVSEIVRTLALVKATLQDSPQKISDLMDTFLIDPGVMTRDNFINVVIQALGECKKQTNVIDFNDMIYLPIVYNLPIGKWDCVLVDEAQDLNFSQICLVERALRSDSRFFAFLDDRQAIYSFRASDIKAINSMIDKFNCAKLSLPISYRCPNKVISLAQKYVPDIKARDNAPEGIVEDISVKDLLKKVKVGDFILSRTNAPLVKHCMALLKQGTPANIQGKDIGANLLNLVKRSKAKTIEGFLTYLEKWRQEETRRFMIEKKDLSIVQDKVECLSNLCEGTTSIKQLKDNINILFADEDDQKKVILSTVHKVKGLERNRVFMLMSTFRPGASVEEDNLAYVALTRAIQELYQVGKTKDKQQDSDNDALGYGDVQNAWS